MRAARWALAVLLLAASAKAEPADERAEQEPPPTSSGTAAGARPASPPLPKERERLDLSAAAKALRLPALGSPWADALPVAPPRAPVDTRVHFRAEPVKDPYPWLEKPADPRTKAFVKAQTKASRAYLDLGDDRRKIRDRLAELSDFEVVGMPSKRGSRYAYFKQAKSEGERALYVSDRLYGAPRLLIDPLEFNKEGTAAIAGTAFSPDGKLVAYAIRRDGSDWAEWRVRDVETGKDLPDRLPRSFAGKPLTWSPDGKGFYYLRYRATKPGEKYTAVKDLDGLYYHALGAKQAKDEKLAQHGAVHFVGGGKLQVLDFSSQLHVREVADRSPWRPLAVGSSTSTFELAGSVGETFYLVTDVGSPRRRLVAIKLGSPEPRDWKTVVPEGEEVLSDASLVHGRLAVVWSDSGYDRVELYDLDGKPQGRVKLPGAGSVAGFKAWRDGRALYTFTSFLQPPTVYRYNFATGESTAFRPPKPRFDPDRYAVEQVDYPSKDGTLISMDLVYKKDLKRDGTNPTYLYGYGGFGVTLEPGFKAETIAWLERGGIHAVAHLRGGGELGSDWHDAGKLDRKQNVFDDFIAAAEWLIAKKYTSPKKLSIGGGSNGGLLVGAVAAQRPDLFGAAVPEVGVHDMTRFDKFTVGRGWQRDYGDPDKKADFDVMSKYSPYHNLKAGTDYPATLVMTSDHDDRVVPSHSYKFGAALQKAHAGPDPVLIRTQRDAGHAGSVSWRQWLSSEADRLTFLFRALGETN